MSFRKLAPLPRKPRKPAAPKPPHKDKDKHSKPLPKSCS
jgi:hypothetical protein